MSFKKIICVDFDGVIHWYRKGWCDGKIYDEPVPGAIQWLVELVASEEHEVCIYSSRSKDTDLLHAMKVWIYKQVRIYNLIAFNDATAIQVIDRLKFPTEKPPAWLTIDDRAICFTGTFPSISDIDNFKPWQIE